MKNKLKTIILILATIIGVGSLLIPAPAFADDPCRDDLPEVVKEANGCNGTGSTDQLPKLIQNVLNAIIAVSGLVAVVFVVIGGVQYMTSTGDAGKVKKAKDTILYALIGLIICVLSFAIVNWTIKNVIGGQRSTSTTEETEDSGSH